MYALDDLLLALDALSVRVMARLVISDLSSSGSIVFSDSLKIYSTISNIVQRLVFF